MILILSLLLLRDCNLKILEKTDDGEQSKKNPEHEISKIYLDFAEKIKSTYL